MFGCIQKEQKINSGCSKTKMLSKSQTQIQSYFMSLDELSKQDVKNSNVSGRVLVTHIPAGGRSL